MTYPLCLQDIEKLSSKHVQCTAICSSSKLTFLFSQTKVCVSFPTLSRPYPQLPLIKWNNCLFFSSNFNCWYLQFPHWTSNYSKEKLFLQQDFDASGRRGHLTLDCQIYPVLWWKSKLCSLGIIRNTVLFIFQIEMFSFSSRSRDYISFRVPCQILTDRPACIESSVPCSLVSDVQIHFIYRMCHTALVLLTFITFYVLNKIMNYDHSKRVIKVDGFDRSKFWGGRNTDISISSKKIKIMLPGNY
jgi:hypothetical protein